MCCRDAPLFLDGNHSRLLAIKAFDPRPSGLEYGPPCTSEQSRPRGLLMLRAVKARPMLRMLQRRSPHFLDDGPDARWRPPRRRWLRAGAKRSVKPTAVHTRPDRPSLLIVVPDNAVIPIVGATPVSSLAKRGGGFQSRRQLFANAVIAASRVAS
jgi:hypothetical protein